MKIRKQIKNLNKHDIDLICDYQMFAHGNCLKCPLKALCAISDDIYSLIQKYNNGDLRIDLAMERQVVVCDTKKD